MADKAGGRTLVAIKKHLLPDNGLSKEHQKVFDSTRVAIQQRIQLNYVRHKWYILCFVDSSIR